MEVVEINSESLIKLHFNFIIPGSFFLELSKTHFSILNAKYIGC